MGDNLILFGIPVNDLPPGLKAAVAINCHDAAFCATCHKQNTLSTTTGDFLSSSHSPVLLPPSSPVLVATAAAAVLQPPPLLLPSSSSSSSSSPLLPSTEQSISHIIKKKKKRLHKVSPLLDIEAKEEEEEEEIDEKNAAGKERRSELDDDDEEEEDVDEKEESQSIDAFVVNDNNEDEEEKDNDSNDDAENEKDYAIIRRRAEKEEKKDAREFLFQNCVPKKYRKLMFNHMKSSKHLEDISNAVCRYVKDIINRRAMEIVNRRENKNADVTTTEDSNDIKTTADYINNNIDTTMDNQTSDITPLTDNNTDMQTTGIDDGNQTNNTVAIDNNTNNQATGVDQVITNSIITTTVTDMDINNPNLLEEMVIAAAVTAFYYVHKNVFPNDSIDHLQKHAATDANFLSLLDRGKEVSMKLKTNIENCIKVFDTSNGRSPNEELMYNLMYYAVHADAIQFHRFRPAKDNNSGENKKSVNLKRIIIKGSYPEEEVESTLSNTFFVCFRKEDKIYDKNACFYGDYFCDRLHVWLISLAHAAARIQTHVSTFTTTNSSCNSGYFANWAKQHKSDIMNHNIKASDFLHMHESQLRQIALKWQQTYTYFLQVLEVLKANFSI